MARIIVETDTVMVFRHARMERAWCPGCRAAVDVITLCGAGLPEWLNTGRLHLWQQSEGLIQICLVSLLLCFEPDEVPNFRIAKEKT